MPAFTFEKISPPVRRNPAPPAEEKQRGRIVQLLDRFAEVRTRRALRKQQQDGAPQQDRNGPPAS
jgi:hypothetical protein